MTKSYIKYWELETPEVVKSRRNEVRFFQEHQKVQVYPIIRGTQLGRGATIDVDSFTQEVLTKLIDEINMVINFRATAEELKVTPAYWEVETPQVFNSEKNEVRIYTDHCKIQVYPIIADNKLGRGATIDLLDFKGGDLERLKELFKSVSSSEETPKTMSRAERVTRSEEVTQKLVKFNMTERNMTPEERLKCFEGIVKQYQDYGLEPAPSEFMRLEKYRSEVKKPEIVISNITSEEEAFDDYADDTYSETKIADMDTQSMKNHVIMTTIITSLTREKFDKLIIDGSQKKDLTKYLKDNLGKAMRGGTLTCRGGMYQCRAKGVDFKVYTNSPHGNVEESMTWTEVVNTYLKLTNQEIKKSA